MTHRLFMIALASCVLAGCGQGSSPDAAVARGRATEGLSYTLSPPEGFAIFMDNGKVKNWTPGGRPVTPTEPRIILTRSSKVYPAMDEVRQLAPEEMIRGLDKSLAQPVILGTTPVTIDGMPGFETTARALTVADRETVMVYAASLFGADGTFHVVAFDGGDDAKDSVELFRAAARSFAVK